MDVRNIAIIAHVDHGKTTLVNALLTNSGTFRQNEEIQDRMMDSNPIEHERGITILAKTTSLKWKDSKINIVDTPGHADFGGEVERIMHMVDGCLLVVDAYEGTMPQTRFVLKNALENHIKPIVVINKVDRPNADPKKAVDEVLDLFIELGAPDDLLEFPIVYVSALNGTSSLSADPASQQPGMAPLFDMILKEIPAPKCDPNGPFQWQSALLDYNDFVGRIGIGTVRRGTIHVGDSLTDIRKNGTNTNFKVMKLYTFYGMNRSEVSSVEAGDICGIAGLADMGVSDTICESKTLEALPPLRVDEPTLQMEFGTNSSPMRGQDGKLVTARVIEERLFEETQRDVSLRFIRKPNTETWIVSGRGELHLGVLIETMRREGYEFQVSPPRVLTKEVNGVLCEPMERVVVDVPENSVGAVMEKLSSRKGEFIQMNPVGNRTKLEFLVPSRGLFGYRNEFLTDTRGEGILASIFDSYAPMKGEVSRRNTGSLVAFETGESIGYGLFNAQDRGALFIGPGVPVYAGMVVGSCPKNEDISVNICKKKQLTNMRAAGSDDALRLITPRQMSLEQCMEFLADDELLEVTPKSLRIRKRILDHSMRMKAVMKDRRTD